MAPLVTVLPFGEDQEELVDQRGRHGVGVELAGSGHQHGPRDSAQKAQHVGIDAATCGRYSDNKGFCSLITIGELNENVIGKVS